MPINFDAESLSSTSTVQRQFVGSISYWFNLDTFTPFSGYLLGMFSAPFYFAAFGAADIYSAFAGPIGVLTFTPSLDTWYHLVQTWDSGDSPQRRLYINGSQVDSASDYSMSTESSQTLGFGTVGTYGSDNLDGQLADVRLYDRVLDPNEIQNMYQSQGRVCSPTDIRHHWPMGDTNSPVSAQDVIADNEATISNGTPGNAGRQFNYRKGFM